MVIGLATAAIQMGMALPTGFLFGVGYGTGVRIGYEQVYPLLFPKGARSTTSELTATMKGMNTVYDAIGGKDASRMGIAVGITNAGEILNNPDFQVLQQLESSSSGLTSSNSNLSERLGRGALDLSPLPEESFRDTTPQFTQFYNSIQTMTLQTVIIEYGKAQNYKNGWSISQNNDLLIPALKTRLSFLRSPSSIQQPIVNTVPVRPPAPSRLATTTEQEYNTWSAKLQQLQEIHRKVELNMGIGLSKVNVTRGAEKIEWQRQADKHKAHLRILSSQIRAMSNDYRSPNNTIRTHALRLRQEIANGNWK